MMPNICILLKRRKPVSLHNISIETYLTNEEKVFDSFSLFFGMENRAH
jgi:hypothetical protein